MIDNDNNSDDDIAIARESTCCLRQAKPHAITAIMMNCIAMGRVRVNTKIPYVFFVDVFGGLLGFGRWTHHLDKLIETKIRSIFLELGIRTMFIVNENFSVFINTTPPLPPSFAYILPVLFYIFPFSRL